MPAGDTPWGPLTGGYNKDADHDTGAQSVPGSRITQGQGLSDEDAAKARQGKKKIVQTPGGGFTVVDE